MNIIEIINKKASSDIEYTGFTTFVNPFSYLKLRKEKYSLQCVDRIHFDGIIAVIFFKIILKKHFIRRSFDFTSVAEPFFLHLIDEKKKLAVIGSTLANINLFVSRISAMYPGLEIVYHRDGYFKENEIDSIYQAIDHSGADYLLVGMGTPGQEIFLSDYKLVGKCKNAFTCGGFIHQTACSETGIYYPDIFNKLNLRWLYRMVDEPALIKRYFVYYPCAIVLMLSDAIRFYWNSRE